MKRNSPGPRAGGTSSRILIEVWPENLDPRCRRLIAAAARATVQREGEQPGRLSIAVLRDAAIAELHERYLGLAGPTDVMAFDLGDGDLDGQIVVSADAARREARARRLPFEQELLRYVVHGTLHLLGHRDDTAAQAKRMHAIEDELLAVLVPAEVREPDPSRNRRPRGPRGGRPLVSSRPTGRRGGRRIGRPRAGGTRADDLP